jgi:uncharacterized protein with von Willebrand factor type A (vWA) domain
VRGLDDLRARGERLLPHFDALLEDLFAALFKLVVRVRPEETVPASTLVNRQILLAALSPEGFTAIKEETALDAARAAHAACALASRALALVKSGDLFLDDELLAAKALADEEEALARNEAAAEDLGSEAGALGDALDALVSQGKARKKSLERTVARSVDELPPRFREAIAQKTLSLSEDMPRGEDAAKDFARAVGGNGPRTASERLALAEKLAGNEKLKTLARLAGALRADARAVRRRRRERSNTEMFRVGQGAELGRLLPSELLALRHAGLRRDFLRRFLEKELLEYDLRGDDRHGRGPLVVCLDGSGSMSGPRELWAKAVALALFDIARGQGRRAHAIVFSGTETALSAFDLTSKRAPGGKRPLNLSEVVRLAECFPGGGTDFQKPLAAALSAVKTSPLRGADIVFITDGEAKLEDGFVAEVEQEKRNRDLTIYGVLVDDPGRNVVPGERAQRRAASELGKVADFLTSVTELTSESVKGLFKLL